MKETIKKFILPVILISLISVLGILSFRQSQSAQAQGPCQLLKIGQVPKRLLAIQDELISLAGFMIEKYSALSNHALTMADLVGSCDIKKCKAGQCRGEDTTGLGICQSGEACSDPGGNEDICPDGVREKLKREAEIADQLMSELLNIGGLDIDLGVKLLALKNEINLLKQALRNAENNLSHWNPQNSVLLSCYQAKNQGLVKSCKWQLPFRTVLGLLLPNEPDSNFDYYICPITRP